MSFELVVDHVVLLAEITPLLARLGQSVKT